MPSTRGLVRSFIGGECSPEMLARLDDARVQNGAARLRNMQVTAQGVAFRRPGTRIVARAKTGHTAPLRVITYEASSTQKIGVELGAGYARFHGTTGPVLYCPMRVVTATDTANDTVSFDTPHGLLTDDIVRIIEVSGAGAVPTGVDHLTTYFAVIVDAYTIKLSDTAGGGAIRNLTSAATGTTVVTKNAETPVQFATPVAVSSVNLVTNVITYATSHLLTTGTKMYVRAITATVVPTLPAGSVAWARVVNATDITLHPTQADALAGTATYDFTLFTSMDVRKFFAVGDLIYWPGVGRGFFYALASINDVALPAVAPPADATHWYRLPDNGQWELPLPYTASDLFQITYDQDEANLVLCHASYDPRRLSLSGSTWYVSTVTFASSLSAPVLTSVDESRRGIGVAFAALAVTVASPAVFTTATPHFLASGDVILLDDRDNPALTKMGDSDATIPDFYRVTVLTPTTFNLTKLNTGASVNNLGPGTGAAGVVLRPTLASADLNNTYCVTAVDADNRESPPSNELTAFNNLLVDGAANVLTWTAVAGATRYRVYKKQNSLFGLIGDVAAPAVTLTDDNIGPDMAFTLPLQDSTLSAGTHPGAVGHFEQRAAFGAGRTLVLTQTGTDSDLTFHIPVLDTDRIQLPLKVSRRVSIRHLIGFGHLLVLTDGLELRVTPLNSDALTASSASVRPQSFVGSSYVRPQPANSTVVFAGARGGHVYEMGFRQEAGGFITNDLCLRAAHLFDGRTVLDSARVAAPQPTLWFVSSGGGLLGCTYVPEESIVAWHQHDTDGVVESCTEVSDPTDPAQHLMLVVRRTVNGTTERYIECTTTERATGDSAVYVDSALLYDGHATGYDSILSAITLHVTGGLSYGPGETLTLLSGIPIFRAADVGVATVRLTDSAGVTYTLTLTAFVDATTMRATVDKILPTELRSPTTNWVVQRATFPGLSHLEGKTVRGTADGVPFSATVVGGSITLASRAGRVVIGLGYTSSLRTVPQVLQADGAGQGMRKNPVTAVVRVADSSPFLLGALDYRLSPVPASRILDGVVRANIEGNWNELGQITIEQRDPLPLSVLGAALETAVSG